MQINGHRVDRVVVVDDDPAAREAYFYAIEELRLQPIVECGPLESVNAALNVLRTKGDALVCDYHLRKRNFSTFDGDDLVAGSYRIGFPSILCTSYTDFDLTLMRSKRRSIPALVRADDLSPEMIKKAFTRCINEHSARFDPSRKPWRTLVRFEEVFPSEGYCYVVVPAWNPDQKIRLLYDDLPSTLKQEGRQRTRVHAKVNIGAKGLEEIYFDDWEVE